ncbi:hypothetical protein PTSG_00044 [Salpingoeca rosetta]|uniref:Uncharacterized protein n=1 Tax=Salpingoeca rosetta (strain ATCC 50818 / BSB-021) TaxID=946362 RepID=F2TVD2_SALR5|nr:uncharacterized protein PTSG_00044 [Salpingoeca rosetta]EGD72028.1 hypothetical protein PTSG_00044 [Salpingoeca rosetta]|eukprot:XP_004998600.1 hypothetical protein PTSG_00044 [Salpingoeca rosetta]
MDDANDNIRGELLRFLTHGDVNLARLVPRLLDHLEARPRNHWRQHERAHERRLHPHARPRPVSPPQSPPPRRRQHLDPRAAAPLPVDGENDHNADEPNLQLPPEQQQREDGGLRVGGLVMPAPDDRQRQDSSSSSGGSSSGGSDDDDSVRRDSNSSQDGSSPKGANERRRSSSSDERIEEVAAHGNGPAQQGLHHQHEHADDGALDLQAQPDHREGNPGPACVICKRPDARGPERVCRLCHVAVYRRVQTWFLQERQRQYMHVDELRISFIQHMTRSAERCISGGMCDVDSLHFSRNNDRCSRCIAMWDAQINHNHLHFCILLVLRHAAEA